LTEGEEMGLWLKGLLRFDANVILIGEIRDRDTAVTALRAAQTGHLVLSTLHTDAAWLVPARFREFGVDMAIFATKIRGIVNQRLVRRLCANCRVPDTNPSTLDAIARVLRTAPDTLYQAGEGCALCGHTGYRGRIVIYELLPINATVRGLIAANAGPLVLAEQIAAAHRLWGCALTRVAAGITSLEEAIRVVGRPEEGR
jgi:type II secretory ATPase GspE/PulE/Tfp pilus assembly ATPase PilB-like protein